LTNAHDLDDLLQAIKDAEADLAAMRKEYRERRTAGLKAAIEARNEADKAVRDEMRALGVSYYRHSTPSNLWF
jgi:aspartate aminotransferase-like enzyme